MNVTYADMQGKICVVTGANSGTGYVTALELAKSGATVVMVCRNAEKGEAAQAAIRAAAPKSKIDLIIVDLADMAQVRRLARELGETYPAIHVLVNNAGGVVMPRRQTAQGLEAMFAGNYLGHFLLTMLLLDTLKCSGAARIVNVSSTAHKSAHIEFDDLQLAGPGKIRNGYGQSKLAQILFTYELAERLKGSDVTVNAMHPGAVRSGFKDGVPPFARPIAALAYFLVGISPEKGADTILYLATDPAIAGVTGKYFIKREAVATSATSYDRELQRHLFEVSEKLLQLF
jgi:NAD(P)-dependent dehydrogenase (short-subunit alcohol dehydrogenase family)